MSPSSGPSLVTLLLVVPALGGCSLLLAPHSSGGAGRIRINTLTGEADLAGAVISPGTARELTQGAVARR